MNDGDSCVMVQYLRIMTFRVLESRLSMSKTRAV
jgi:hypothetical protein